MNGFRRSLINKAFTMIDKNNDGKISEEDIALAFRYDKHPKAINGEYTKEKCINEILRVFQKCSQRTSGEDLKLIRINPTSYWEFEDYYAGISASISSDVHFDLLLRNTWGL